MPSIGRKEGDTGYIKTWQMEPLPIASLSAMTPACWEKKFFDDRLEEIDYETWTDLVAITVETYTARRSYEISRLFREKNANPDIKIVMGGFHPTLVESEVLQFADAIVSGDGENVWPNLLEDFENNNLKQIYKANQSRIVPVTPDRSILKEKKYLKISLVETGRGCRFNCDFCTICEFYNHQYTMRPIEDVVNEIRSLGTRTFFFVDDNIVVDRAHAKELFRALIPLKIRWFSQGSIDMSSDPELLHLMKQSGCAGILIGFESLDPETLKKMNKRVNLLRDRDRAIYEIHRAGLRIYSTFIFGYDSDTKETFQEAFDFVMRHRFFLGAFNHVVPFPGTKLYERLKAENRLLDDTWWLNHSYTFGKVGFQPVHFTPDELTDLCFTFRKKFYSYGSIAKRFLEPVNIQNPWAYLFINAISRRDISRRQGLTLGKGTDIQSIGATPSQ